MSLIESPATSPALPVLSAPQQRVLGSLLEKEVTVAASYPMTVNSVRVACNQTSSREPVVDYDERVVHETLRELKALELAAVTWSDTGKRTMKYLQTFAVRHALPDDQRALLTVLLLRGAQPPGALRSRTERLHAFADRTDVEACLRTMAALDPPLVRELPRRPREQDSRWIHLLGPVALPEDAAGGGGAGAAAASGVDREVVLVQGAAARDDRVRAAYDAVAQAYADALDDELDSLPLESWLLRRVVELVDGDGGAPVVEVGTGPGHVAAFLAAAGARASGLDLSPAMVEQARARHPGVTYDVGDLRRLMKPASHDGWGAVLAWYSLIHLAASELPDALAALVRPLRTGGWLVLALHAGAEVRHLDSWFDQDVDLDGVLHDPAEVVELVRAAGLVDVEWYLRGPITARGEDTDRLYVLARRP